MEICFFNLAKSNLKGKITQSGWSGRSVHPSLCSFDRLISINMAIRVSLAAVTMRFA